MPLCRLCRCAVCTVVFLVVICGGGLGCNVFDGVGPSPNSVKSLLADARVAMTNGNAPRAVQLLETAFDSDSTDVEVRIELSNALYAANAVDLFAVRSTVEHLNGMEAQTTSEGSEAVVCTDDADPSGTPDRFPVISLVDHTGLQTLAAGRGQIQRVSRLVVDGVLNRRTEAFAALSAEVRSKGLLLAALTRLSRRLLAVRDTLSVTESTLLVDEDSTPPGALVACGPTVGDLDQVERSLCRHEEGVSQSVLWLERRNELSSSEQTALLLDVLKSHREALRTRLPCARSSGTDVEHVVSQRAPAE